MNNLKEIRDKQINIADIPKAKLDAIFDKMGDDLELQNKLDKIENNPIFEPHKKLILSKHHIALAFQKYYFNEKK